MKPYLPHAANEYRSYLDLPKREHLGDFDRYPRVEGLRNTFGWFEVREFTGKVYAIAEPYHEQNGCFYLVLGDKKALVFDTGLGIYDPRPLVEELAADRELVVVNSHFHFDHAGGNHYFDKVFVNADVYSEKVAKKGLHSDVILEQVRDEAFPLGVPEGFNQRTYGTDAFNYEAVTDGQLFDLGGRRLEVMYAPGHSGDCICLIDEANDLVLAGDLFYLGALYCQFASSDFGYSDPEAYGRSMKKLYSRINDETRVLCCHNAFEASGSKIGQAAELFDILNDAISRGEVLKTDQKIYEVQEDAQSDLSYGEEGEIYRIQGNGFSIMYAI